MPIKQEETVGFPIVRTVADLRSALALRRAAGQTVGLVPTMGALHEGHLALVHASRAEMDCTVATILVNPLQFGPDEDFESYPRSETEDVAKLSEGGADLLYAPSLEEVYPEGFATKVEVKGLTEVLCGVFRPVHFSGVATVVAKLFLQALPDAAFFGEKDYQQVLVVRQLVRDLDIPVRIEMVPTVREADGLALSSRNAYLTAEERAIAPKLYATLNEMAVRIQKGSPIVETVAAGEAALREAGFGSIDYLEVRDPETLALVEAPGKPARIFAAVHLGKARLIDNLAVPA
ncbi:MAG: pantoate--beta-alanine ligase [Alphaproteobacteria bacterium]